MNTKSRLSRCWWLGMSCCLAIGGAIADGDCAFAQKITPDATLGTERSVVTPSVVINGLPSDRIDGGAIRGSNLFHSFQQFNVDAGRAAYFTNPAGIKNILSRVTGGSRSEILGKLGVLGNANLFLINPNGIIFGPSASLDVKGSFMATSADRIQFGNQGFFSTSAPDVPPVLTVNPSALLFNQVAAQPITNQSVAGLSVPDGQSLLLVGGNVSLDGGSLYARGGRIELGGLAGTGTVGLDVNGNNLRLSFPQGVPRTDISLTNQAGVYTSGEGGGDIQVQGRGVTLTDGSRIEADTLGTKPGGTLAVTASDSVELSGTSADSQLPTGLSAQALGTGAGGYLRIDTGRLVIRDGAQVSASTVGRGHGGTLTVNSSDSVKVIGRAPDGRFGSDLGTLVNQQGATGAAGDLTINTGRLIVRDGAQVSSANLGAGRGAALAVNASDSVEVSGTTPGHVSSALTTKTQGAEAAGDLRLETGRLTIRDGAILTSQSSGQGRAGDVSINVGGTLQANNGTILTTATQSSGGAIDIRAKDIRLSGNSDIRTNVFSGAGNGGNINLSARSIIAFDNSDILAFARGGRGGNITLKTPAFFGFRYRPTPRETDPAALDHNNRVDINASGAFTGIITLPDTSFVQNSLTKLPSNLIDTNNLIAHSCITRSRHQRGSFLITGAGGLPTLPDDASNAPFQTYDVPTFGASSSQPSTVSSTASARPWKLGDPILEPQGVYRLPDGQMILSRECSRQQ